MKLNSKVYDVLKWFSLVFLPALTTLYGVIGATCNIPYTQETLTIMVAVDTFIGSIIGLSNMNYNKIKGDDTNGNS